MVLQEVIRFNSYMANKKSIYKPIWAIPFKLIWLVLKGIFVFVFKDISKGVRKTWKRPGKDFY